MESTGLHKWKNDRGERRMWFLVLVIVMLGTA